MVEQSATSTRKIEAEDTVSVEHQSRVGVHNSRGIWPTISSNEALTLLFTGEYGMWVVLVLLTRRFAGSGSTDCADITKAIVAPKRKTLMVCWSVEGGRCFFR